MALTVRDKFWLFASREHDDDIYLGNNTTQSWMYSKWSRITPAEGALMLGVNNIIMVASDGIPVPYSKDAYGYMESFCRMKKVMWSCTGSSGFRIGNEERFICHLAEHYNNVCGAYFDDFKGDPETAVPRSPEKVKNLFANVRTELDKAVRPMEMWSTCYVEQLKEFPAEVFTPMDGIIIWNLNVDGINTLEEGFSEYEKLLPNKRKMLGIYIYDYRQRRAVPDELMEKQCELGLEWLKSGRIEGMVFLTNCVMGVGLTSEYWLRDWIDKVGDEEL